MGTQQRVALSQVITCMSANTGTVCGIHLMKTDFCFIILYEVSCVRGPGGPLQACLAQSHE